MYIGLPSLTYRLQPPKRPAWERITPLAPPFGISTSAVMVCERFLVLMKTFSVIPIMPS